VQPVIAEAPKTSTARRQQIVVAATFVLVSGVYLAQCATPLRLINDGIDYLLQASSALDGHGFLLHGVGSMRPAGYPAIVFALSKLGLGSSWAIVALNCLMLGTGTWAGYFVLRAYFGFSSQVAQVISLLTLFSYLMVRNVTYPLSDVSYFGLSVPCLLMLSKTETGGGTRRWMWLIPVVPMMAFCIEVRTIGIVLIPAFLWSALGGMPAAQRMYPVVRRYRPMVFAFLLVVAIVVGRAFFHSRYLQFNLPIFLHRGIGRSITANIGYHTAEWGELTVNAPLSKLPAAVEWPMRILGAFAIITFVVGIWTKLRQLNGLLLYVVGGACIVFAYPWFDTRLWLPFIPFLMGYMFIGLKRIISPRILHPILVAYCAYFCLLGSLALGYSTRVTFAGRRFPDVFGDGNLRATYKFALRSEQPTNGSEIDSDALYLLRRFEPRAAK